MDGVAWGEDAFLSKVFVCNGSCIVFVCSSAVVVIVMFGHDAVAKGCLSPFRMIFLASKPRTITKIGIAANASNKDISANSNPKNIFCQTFNLGVGIKCLGSGMRFLFFFPPMILHFLISDCVKLAALIA